MLPAIQYDNLQGTGAILTVQLGITPFVARHLSMAGFTSPTPQNLRAQIDTGAFCTVIGAGIGTGLGLRHRDFRTMQSANGPRECPLFLVRLVYDPVGAESPYEWEGEVVEMPLPANKPFDCLIGRDILADWHLEYDGPNNRLSVSY